MLCLNFLWRPLFEAFPQVLAPGGLLVFAQPTPEQPAAKPASLARFLLEDGELPGLLRGLEVISYTKGGPRRGGTRLGW